MPSRSLNGRLSIVSPTASSEYGLSRRVSSLLVSLILDQSFHYSVAILYLLEDLRPATHNTRRQGPKIEADQLKSELSDDVRSFVLLVKKEGTSNWLTSLPIHEYRFILHKRTFRSIIAMWLAFYGNPAECVCGNLHFSMEHTSSCMYWKWFSNTFPH